MSEGGWETQADLFASGKVTTDACQACLGAIGTCLHRCVGYPARAPSRHAYKNQHVIRKAQSIKYSGDALFAFGVPVALPRVPKPRMEIRYVGGAENKIFTVYGFCDGSMKRRGFMDDNRGVWAAVICDAQGNLLFGIYGTIPHMFPTAFNAELLAVIMFPRLCTPPITIYTDNQAVVNGW